MANNRGKKSLPETGCDEAEYILNVFDNLSPETREALANFPIQIQTRGDHRNPGLARYIKEMISDTIQSSAMMEYGPDHPQAQGLFCKPLRR